jgi:hypothetical protein
MYLTYCLSDSTSVTFLTEYNITIFLHVFVFCIICRKIHCIHSRWCLLFLARLCVLLKYWSLSWVTWRAFHSDTSTTLVDLQLDSQNSCLFTWVTWRAFHSDTRPQPWLISNLIHKILVYLHG